MSESLKVKSLPFTGKLVTAVDAGTIGENFSLLQNMRYTDSGLRGIGGMTKINSAALASPQIRNMCFFQKPQPAETHLVVQSFDPNSANPVLYDSTAAVPAVGTFSSLYTENATAGTAFFALSNSGELVVCDGQESLVWGGDEFRSAGFINYDPNGSFLYNYSSEIQNTLTDAKNVAVLHTTAGGSDSNCMLLLHFDNDVTDSSPTTPHTVTNTNCTFDSANKVFGSHAVSFNGTTAELSIPDNADFDFSGGNFTLDFRGRITDLAANRYLYYQATDANNYFELYVSSAGAVTLNIVAASVSVVAVATAAGAVVANTYYHIAVVESGDNWYIFIDGALKKYVSDTSRAANYTGIVYLGSSGAANWFAGQMDEFRVSNTARWTAAFVPPISAYGTSAEAYCYLGAVRPLKGFKGYVSTANTVSSVMSVSYWDGSAWVAVSSLVDGTSVGGKSLAQTGTISFTDTKTLAKLKIVENLQLYWYRVSFTAMSSGTALSYITTNASLQEIRDIWDGILRTAYGFFTYDNSTYNDLTIGVSAEDISSANTATYAELDSLTTGSDYVVVGFSDRISALDVVMGGTAVNTTADCQLTVSYWNGSSWTAVSALSDGTVTGTSSLAQSGTISWGPPEAENEFTTTIAGGVQLYYYKLAWSQTLSADVKVDYVGGIPAQRELAAHRFAVFSQNRLMLCSNQHNKRNAILMSAADSTNIFNGEDSMELLFGDDAALTGGVSLYTQFGSSLYNLSVFCKDSQTWVLTGTGPADWQKYQVSDTIGCPAPLTMKIAALGYDPGATQNRFVAIWQGAEGVYLFDGRNIRAIHDDIQDLFDKRNSSGINRDKIRASVGFFDAYNQEYHWCFAGGASTSLNREFVYDLKRSRWYETVRTPLLQAGVEVTSTLGNRYTYGGTLTGYVERIENGNDFDGTAIAQSVQFGDAPLVGSLFEETEIRSIQLVQVAKNVTSNSVTLTHYGDSSTAGTAITLSPAATGKRLAIGRAIGTGLGPFNFHSFKLQLTTSNETTGFEPLYLGLLYRDIRTQRS